MLHHCICGSRVALAHCHHLDTRDYWERISFIFLNIFFYYFI